LTALPPPPPKLFSAIGLQLGVIYGIASVAVVGIWAVVFVILGYLMGYLLDD
jgi:hypothetical protein